ncbi:hypothetical protein CAL7716_043900 [Calothrix sp. PCC 7716]|nr:hypothetical protein CAL7716_043900 [Calothrix sp. PCC 7716]
MDIENPVIKQEFIKKWRSEFGGNTFENDWAILQLGTNQFVTNEPSELKIRSGVIPNAQTIILSKKTFTIPCRVFFIYYLTQRIANQSFFLEVVDDSGSHYARFNLSGTSNTSAIGQTANSWIVSNDASLTIPNSSLYSCLELDLGIDELKFVSKAIDSIVTRSVLAIRNRKLPNPNLEYYIRIRVANNSTPPSSSTDLFLDSVSYQSYELISADIYTSRNSQSISESLPVAVVNQANISGSVNIADGGQSVQVTTANLAANATFTSGSNNANGRNTLTITIVTSSPGTLYVDQSINGSTWLFYPGLECVAGVNTFDVYLNISSYRIRYINGNTATSNFAIYTKGKI